MSRLLDVELDISTETLCAKFQSKKWMDYTGCPSFDLNATRSASKSGPEECDVILRSWFIRAGPEGRIKYRLFEDFARTLALQCRNGQMDKYEKTTFSGPSPMPAGVRAIIEAGLRGVIEQEAGRGPSAIPSSLGEVSEDGKSFSMLVSFKPRMHRSKRVKLNFSWTGSFAKSEGPGTTGPASYETDMEVGL